MPIEKIRCPILVNNSSVREGSNPEAIVFFDCLSNGDARPTGIMCEYYDTETDVCSLKLKEGNSYNNKSCSYSEFKRFKRD